MSSSLVAGNRNGAKSSAVSDGIAIVGMSGRYPGGANSPDLLWEILKSGKDAVGEAKGDRWDLGWHHPDTQRQGRVYTRAGGFLDQIDGFDADFFGLSPREVRQVDPQQRLLLELAWEAHEDAGIAPRSRAGSDTGVFVGISSNDYAALLGPEWPDAYSNTGCSFSIAANRISYIFDFHGPSIALDTACSSSVVCVHQACASIMAGECSAALAGGVSLLTHIRPWLGFARASMLSPTGRCKSFDESGDGYVRSEGGGLLLLKPLAAAERDGDRILGVILASGVNSDGRTMGLSMPNGEAQEKLLRSVYAQCGVKPEDVYYVEAHGTGTAVGDPIECGALGRVLGEPRSDGSTCLIGSVKSNIGHLEAASGMAGIAKALLVLKHREIPGNLHFNNPNPKIDFAGWKLEVVTGPKRLPEGKAVVIGVNSFGFGGTNAHLAIQEYSPKQARVKAGQKESSQSILVISGNSETGLQVVAQAYIELLRGHTPDTWEDICAAAAICRSPLRFRLAVAACTKEEAATKLENHLAGKATTRLATGSVNGRSAPIAFVYSGNGPQWWGMGRELLAENATFHAEIEAVDAIFAPLAGWSLLAEMRRPESETRIALTEVAQPLLFAQQLGLTKVLQAAGVNPCAVLGHSVGEVAAAHICGALTREQATRVIFHRSMEQGKTAGMGRMAALGVSPEEARTAIASISGWLELAAINSPQSVTVAGDPEALEKLVQAMTAAGKFARLLLLDYPFHTKAMDPIRDGLTRALNDLTPIEGTVPFISTVVGTEKPGQELDAAYWYDNVRQPVRFHDAVNHLLKDRGVAVFIEIGPHPVLKDYVLQSAKAIASNAAVLQTLRRPGTQGRPEPESDNLWTAVCACYAHGALDLSTVFSRPMPPPVLPLYPWQRSRHWRGRVILPDVDFPTERDHPLLGFRMTSADGLWENTLDTHLLPFLKDHVVQQAVLFPAAGYIELALAAGQLILGKGPIEAENFIILRPLTIAPHADPLIQTSVDAKDGTLEIRSRPDWVSEEWTAHARARLSRVDARTMAEPANLAELSSRMPHAVSATEHYADATNRGLQYGPAFQGVASVLMTAPDALKREALAEIKLPSLETSGLEGYLAHPSLLDSCIQVLITLIAQNDTGNRSTIPVQLGRVRSLAPLTSSMFCHVVMQSESERSAVANFRLMDPDGNLLLHIAEARCQKVDFQHSAATPLITEWWRPDTAAAVLADVAPLPTPSQLHDSVSADLGRIVSENERAAYNRDIRPEFERLIGCFAAQAIAALMQGDGAFDLPRLARKGGVKRHQSALLEKLVRLAEQDGQLVATGSSWRWNPDHRADSAETIWRDLFEKHPRYGAELLLLADVGNQLANQLRGEETGEHSSSLLDQLFDTSPFQATYNQIARAAVERLVASWPADRPMRILEIGGASAGLSAWVLPALPPDRADYVFSDVSEAAVGRAEHRLSAHHFVRFATLDPERDLVEQGQPAAYFDVVLGAHGFVSGNDLSQFLSRLKVIMAPGGILLAIKSNEDRFSAFALGYEPNDWQKALVENGFDDLVLLDDSKACPAGSKPQQSVVLAKLAPVSQPAMVTDNEVVKQRWLLVLEREASDTFSHALTQALLTKGHDVAAHTFSGSEEQIEIAVAAALDARPVDEVVYVSALGTDSASLLEVEMQRCLTSLKIVQALEKIRQEKRCQITFVTRGALPTANGGGPLDPGQAPLWGLGRVVGTEHSALHIRMIDLHSDTNGEQDAGWLAAELLRRDAETEVQIVAGRRYVNRERLTTLTELAKSNGPAPAAFALDFQAHGGLDSLYLREAERRKPAPSEVEIAVEAAGLNFRDVLWAMGMLPEEAVEHGFSGPTIGMECSGRIVRVGEAVTDLKPGQRVVAFASSCFGSHVTTDAGAVASIPDDLDFAAAATIPTAFLTAYYAFDYLARLEPGETVLIHGAAGGVGMAAIQIAKLKGAKVIGTAGSARKRRMLQMLGVDHVLNSRSLEFADEVMQITSGIGVDVVLNSLAGEAITKSLQCLRPFGRFLEIGKRDLYANSRIGLRPFRNNLSYFGIDADTLIVERADLARSIFKKVVAHFANGELRPLPFQVVPISRAAEAFRSMQQSRHVGKLVVSTRLETPASLRVVRSSWTIRPRATYLVTGGMGGFGLATAIWLAEQGATALALVGRRGATTEEAITGIEKLGKMGVTVRAFAADIADSASLDNVLATIRSEMPPLTGVVHSAAVIDDAPLLNLHADRIERVFRPKLLGAWNLHLATLHDPLDMFVLYSSSSAVVGNPGQGAYVAANLFLDSLALYRRSIGLPALAVGWGAIKDAGFLTRHQGVAEMLRTRTGLDATPAQDALADLGRLMAAGATRVCAARFNLHKLGQVGPGATIPPRFLPVIPKSGAVSMQSEETLRELLNKTPETERRSMILMRVREHGARVLGTAASQINLDQPLSELGLDSLMAVELAGGLERDLGQPVSVMQMLSAGSLAAIAELVTKMLGVGSDSDNGSAPAATPPKPPRESSVLLETRT